MTIARRREYLESDEYKKLTAKKQSARTTPEQVPAHEENEWNIQLVEAAQHDEESPREFQPATETLHASCSQADVRDLIAKLEAAQA